MSNLKKLITIFFPLSFFNKQLYLCCLFICLFNSKQFAQDIPFRKSHFKSKKEAYRQAVKELNIADEIIETERDYDKAIRHYLRAYKFNPNNAVLNRKIANCYLQGDRTEKFEAKNYLVKARKLQKDINTDLSYLIGKLYHFETKWDSAIIFYKEYLSDLSITEEVKQAVSIRIKQCENAKLLSEKPVRVFIDNLGKGVNSNYPEYGAVFTSDFETMYFTGRRYSTTGFDIDSDLNYYEDIYESKFLNGRWSRVKNIDVLNSAGHDAVLGLSVDGKKMLIYKGDNNGDIYLSKMSARKWTEPVHFPTPINSKFREVSACYSPDGKQLFIVSDREGTIGDLDIFVSEFKKGIGWSEPKNLGEVINTDLDEDAVFMHPDGKTLFFSSKGHNSIGGYDIFKSELKAGKWTKPVNIGFPVNTPDDDLYYFTDSTKRFAYQSSHRRDSNGAKDIYKITYLGPEKPLELISSKRNEKIPELTLDSILDDLIYTQKKTEQIEIIGIVKNKDGNAIRAIVSLEDILQQNIVVSDTTNKDGRFKISLSSGTDYKLNVSAPGFLFYTEDIQIESSEEKVVILDPIKEGEKVVIQDIYFASGSAKLSVDSQSALDQILAFLKQNSNIKVELAGHTDNVGSKETNNQLSKERAKAVFYWLIDKGISKNRMRYVGKGSSQPVGDNTTEVGRKINRRTELEIVQTGKE